MEEDKTHQIVVHEDGETVELQFGLHDNAEDVAQVLEVAKQGYDEWLRTALFYEQNGKEETYRAILEHADKLMEAEPASTYSERNKRCQIYFSLAGYWLRRLCEDHTDSQADGNFERLRHAGSKYDATHPWNSLLEINREILKVENNTHLNATQREGEYRLQLKRLESIRGFCKTITQQTQLRMSIAICKYKLEEYVEAWKEFADIVTLTPGNTPNSVRLGLAYCNFKLGQEEPAIQSFERAVEVQPNQTRGLLGLAGILLGYQGPDAAERHRQGNKQLVLAMQNSNRDPVVVNMFSNALFRQYYVQKDERISSNIELHLKEVIKRGGDPGLLSEAHFQLGRVAHAKRNFDAAEKSYKKALKSDPRHLLALYSSAQCLIQKNLTGEVTTVQSKDVDAVLELLNTCFDLCPDNVDLLSIMSKLNTWKYMALQDAQARDKTLNDALELLHKITDVANPQDPEAWSLRGFLERLDPAAALSCFEEQVRSLEATNRPIPPSLLNNLAALYIHNNKLDQATTALNKATELAAASRQDTSLMVTLQYNIAILHEKNKNLQEAANKHLHIIKNWPNFVDSYIVLVDLFQQMGQSKKAVALAELAKSVLQTTSSPLPRIQLAIILGRIGFWKHAIKHAEEVSTSLHEATDPQSMDFKNMALLIEANGHYIMAAQASMSQENKNDHLQQAERKYKDIYQQDKNNAYAVHNLACCLASRSAHNVEVVKQLIERVKEAHVPNSDLDDVATFNLAQCCFMGKLPNAALPLYYSLVGRLEDEPKLNTMLPTSDIPSKLAHCHAQKKDFRSAVRGFAHAASSAPLSVSSSANLSLATLGCVLQDFYDDRLKTADDIEKAQGQVATALAGFNRLIAELENALENATPSKAANLSAHLEKLRKHVRLCEEIRELIDDERISISVIQKHAAKTAESFEQSKIDLTTWKETQARQKEAERREKEEAKARRMEEQERKLLEISEALEEEMKKQELEMVKKRTTTEPKPRGRKARRDDDGENGFDFTDAPDSEEDLETFLETQKEDEDVYNRSLAHSSTTITTTTTAPLGKRKRVERVVPQHERDAIEQMDDGSDETYKTESGDEESMLSEGAPTDSDSEAVKKRKKTRQVVGKEKKSKKNKKEKKEKKSKKSRKEVDASLDTLIVQEATPVDPTPAGEETFEFGGAADDEDDAF